VCLSVILVNSILSVVKYYGVKDIRSDNDEAHLTSIGAFLDGHNIYNEDVVSVNIPGPGRGYQKFAYGTVDFFYYLCFYLILDSTTDIEFIGMVVIANICSLLILIYFINKFESSILFLLPLYLSFAPTGNNIPVATVITAFFYYHFKQKDYMKSAISLGIAISCKAFPLLIVLFWLFDKKLQLKHVFTMGITWLMPTFLFGFLGPFYVFKSTILFHIIGREGYAEMGGTLGYALIGNYTSMLLAIFLVLILILRRKHQLDEISIALSSLSFVLFSSIFFMSYLQYFIPVLLLCLHQLLLHDAEDIFQPFI
jgi:hypothetical protein